MDYRGPIEYHTVMRLRELRSVVGERRSRALGPKREMFKGKETYSTRERVPTVNQVSPPRFRGFGMTLAWLRP